MSFTLNPSQSQSFEPCPAGVTPALCYRIIDQGLQETAFGMKRRVLISWLTKHTRQDGEPFSVHQTTTLSSHPQSTLVKMLTNWRGKPLEDGFQLGNVLGAPATILVEHNDNDGTVFANVGTIMPGKKSDAPVCPSHIPLWSIEYPDRDGLRMAMDDLSDSLKGKVSDGWAKLDQAAAVKPVPVPAQEVANQMVDDQLADDEIPF